MKEVRAIFDIGKTNKKCFLFDKNYQEVYKKYGQFEEISDEDGHPAENLPAVEKWIKKIFHLLLTSKKYKVEAINFSTYGASLVHLDAAGNVLTPLYNYTKPYPAAVLKSFYKKYGTASQIAIETASPPSGMLNAGFQLYWIKKMQPKLFKQIRWSLHLPQYFSYLFTGIPLSEFTSIGCHTSLWDYKKGDYHNWVYEEELDQKLPPIVPTTTSINMDYKTKRLRIGVGLHDSSAALLPYLRADRNPFLLVSTGTWSISLNPYSKENLSKKELAADCLNYMRIDGQRVKAARLFLGKEYQEEVAALTAYFKQKKGAHKSLLFDPEIYKQIKNNQKNLFHFKYIVTNRKQPKRTRYKSMKNFSVAFHQLMTELMELQIEAMKIAIGKTKINKIYIDGGFADNDIYVKLIACHFKNIKIRTTKCPLGSALGAAMVITDEKVGKEFLKKNYALKKHQPLMLNT